MSTWLAVLGCATGCYLLKLGGMSVPERALDHPTARRVADLLPVVLLAALVAVQVLGGDEGEYAPDARLVGLAVAVVALTLRAPFLVVVTLAALVTALVRLL